MASTITAAPTPDDAQTAAVAAGSPPAAPREATTVERAAAAMSDADADTQQRTPADGQAQAQAEARQEEDGTQPSADASDAPDTPSSYISAVTSYFSYPVGQVVTKLYRRLSSGPMPSADIINNNTNNGSETSSTTPTDRPSTPRSQNRPPTASSQRLAAARLSWGPFRLRRSASASAPAPPRTMPSRAGRFSSRSSTAALADPGSARSDSATPPPFAPPPLQPLALRAGGSIAAGELLLTRAVAEEVRLLLPPRLQLAGEWTLAYSLERDGSSLATLYARCREVAARRPRAGYVLVVRDAAGEGGESGEGRGSVFGAYLSDPPRPAAHFYGTGECFLWKASVIPFAGSATASPMLRAVAQPGGGGGIGGDGSGRTDISQTRIDALVREANLPPRPSTDTTDLGRSTSIANCELWQAGETKHREDIKLTRRAAPTPSGASTPSRLRFKAFPYSGLNDYMIFCETGFLSIGGGDGHYGLWIDDGCEKGISSPSLTFGNEPLSDEGTKFDILGVEMWYVE